MNQLSLTVCTLLIAIVSSSTLAQQVATLLMYEDQESGSDPYVTRMIVTDAFLRMDFGADNGDFMLFDRSNNTIYNVTHDSQSILVIAPQAITLTSPVTLNPGHQVQATATDQPKVMGRVLQHHRYTVNAEACVDVMSLPGMAEDALQAMAAFYQTLAGQQAKSVDRTPVELLTACGLSLHVFHPQRHLKHGLPVRQWDVEGRSRQLVDINRAFAFDPKMFVLPEDYERKKI